MEDDFLGGVLKIAFGIFLGAALVWGAIEFRARYEAYELSLALQQQQRETQQQLVLAEQRQRADAERRAQHQQATLLMQQQEARRSAELRRAAIEAEQRKSAAWAAFFHPSTYCLQNASVECGNVYMRARQEFERRYAAGQL